MKNIWDIFAPVYKQAMKTQKNIYEAIYRNVRAAAGGKTVLELATGPGLIARNIADGAQSVVATDFASNMIEQAKKANTAQNVTFEVANATSLRYGDKSFDIVIISNALHIIPEPQKALSETDRVLKDDGILIAPNFIFRAGGKKNLWQRILSLAGIRFAHEWTADEYRSFLEGSGWTVTKSEVLKGRIDLLYTECDRA